jgi:hypothetical protein
LFLSEGIAIDAILVAGLLHHLLATIAKLILLTSPGVSPKTVAARDYLTLSGLNGNALFGHTSR